ADGADGSATAVEGKEAPQSAAASDMRQAYRRCGWRVMDVSPGVKPARRAAHSRIVGIVPSCTFSTRRVRRMSGLGFADQPLGCLIRDGSSMTRARRAFFNTLLNP